MEKKIVEENSDRILDTTHFDFLGERTQGKVRDIYTQPDKLIMVACDRHSSFDRRIATIPFKGQVLTQSTLYNFEQTKDIVQNHIIESPDPNVMVVKRCKVVGIEMVVRGYLTGSTETSILTRYNNGQRDFIDFQLPDGLKKNQRFEEPLITPTTKFEKNDRNITEKELIEEGLATQEQWDEIKEVSLKLFKRGQEIAKSRGLILVDTKYEFGYDEDGKLTLIDEVHTSDSSRYWFADSYQERFEAGEHPEFFDREFLRLWFVDNCDPYNDETLPEAPKELVVELSHRYIQLYEQLTGQKFQMDISEDIAKRIEGNLKQYKL